MRRAQATTNMSDAQLTQCDSRIIGADLSEACVLTIRIGSTSLTKPVLIQFSAASCDV